MQPQNNNDAAQWSYNGGENQQPQAEPHDTPQPQVEEPISWTGSEFLDRHKDFSWYLLLGVVLILICGAIFLVSKDYLSVIFVAVMGLLFGVVASRKPKQLQYSVNNRGLQIGSRQYKYGDFKSFSVQRDGAIGYINLLPLKRVATELSIYYPPQEEEKIFNALSQHIPHEQVKESLVDRLFKYFHF